MTLVAAEPGEGIVYLDRVTVRDVDFRRATFGSLAPSGCIFVGCDFRDTVFDRRLAPLFHSRPRSIFRECRFDGADLRRVAPGQTRFERCSFEDARIDDWVVTVAELVECRFAGRIAGVTFHGRPWGREAERLDVGRTVNEFLDNDFRDAELVRCLFIRGIDLRRQRWPEGEAYVRLDRFQQRLTHARAEILTWKDLDARREALELVQGASFLYREQNDVIARRVDDAAPAAPELQRKVWEVLAAVL